MSAEDSLTKCILTANAENPHWAATEIASHVGTSRNYVTVTLRRFGKHARAVQFSDPILAFNDRYIPEPNSGCWLWIGSLSTSGYGRMTIGQRQIQAHRFSFEAHNGNIPDGLEVLHKCDNPMCVNPDHLRAGTHKDNMRDMYAKGRGGKKLTPEHVEKILLDKRGSTTLARQFGVTKRIIQLIRRGELHNRKEWTL